MKNAKALGLKLLAFVLVLAVSVSSSAMFAFAEGADYSNLDFMNGAKPDELILAGYMDPSLASESLVIPSEVEGKKVVAIADYAFYADENLQSVVIPASVKSIGREAFRECSSLAFITFQGDLDYVGISAFDFTPWFNDFPGGGQENDFVVAGINYKYLVGYKGTDANVVIPQRIEKVAAYVFAGNQKIQSVIIPERVTYIGDGAFKGCSSLADVTVRGALEYCGEDAFEDTTWLREYKGEFVFFGDMLLKYKGSEPTVEVPNIFTRIGDKAFYGSSKVQSVKIPSTITSIGKDAFLLFDGAGTPTSAEIYCYKNSAGHTYAVENGLQIGGFLRTMGDYDGDGVITASDARSYLRVGAKLIDKVDYAVLEAGDIDGDGKVTAADARTILRLSARIESFNADDLLLRPNTPFEVLNAYSQALRYAARKEVGFSLFEHQKIKDYNLDFNSTLYFKKFDDQLTKEKKAKIQKFEPDRADSIDSLYLCSLINSGMIKDAKCVINADKKYVIEIKLKDEKAEFGQQSFTSMIFPVASKDDFQKTLKDLWWYGLYGKGVSYNLTYTNCSLKAVVDMKTGRVESIDMNMEYKITDIAGKLGGITIKDGNGKTNGNAVRVDTVKYSDFIFTTVTD
ncbi:MAG: leucine-rich repeat protein [Oscillospiraceae bacterium]|jgi:hypothetical protein|nr:leucine-rich repeat protein [Oscillospiraceae bacterium]